MQILLSTRYVVLIMWVSAIGGMRILYGTQQSTHCISRQEYNLPQPHFWKHPGHEWLDGYNEEQSSQQCESYNAE